MATNSETELEMTGGIMGAYTFLRVTRDKKGVLGTSCLFYPETSLCVISGSDIVTKNGTVTDVQRLTPSECAVCRKIPIN